MNEIFFHKQIIPITFDYLYAEVASKYLGNTPILFALGLHDVYLQFARQFLFARISQPFYSTPCDSCCNLEQHLSLQWK